MTQKPSYFVTGPPSISHRVKTFELKWLFFFQYIFQYILNYKQKYVKKHDFVLFLHIERNFLHTILHTSVNGTLVSKPKITKKEGQVQKPSDLVS